MISYLKINYNDKSITTLKQLFDKHRIVDITYDDFLNYKNPESNITNRQAFFNALTIQQRSEQGLNAASDITEDIIISPPAILFVPKGKVNIDLITHESAFVKETDYEAFLSDEVKKVFNSPEYRNSQLTKGSAEISCYIWCKALFDAENVLDNSKIQGKIIDFSKFIFDIKTSVTDTGGNFTITMSSIPASVVKYFYGDGKNSEYRAIYNPNSKKISSYGENVVVKSSIHKDLINQVVSVLNKTSLKRDLRENSYEKDVFVVREHQFNMLSISINDIVFIKFDNEKKNSELDSAGFTINNDQLPGNIFDMIGLVDNVTIDTNNTDITVTIQGRDLMKLILDDGTFFFFNSYSNPSSEGGVFMNATDGTGDGSSTLNKIIENGWNSSGRFFGTGNGRGGVIMGLFNPSFRTIRNVIDIIIKQLSNIQICHDDLFEYYSEKRTRFAIEQKSNGNKQNSNKKLSKTEEKRKKKKDKIDLFLEREMDKDLNR